MSSLDRNIFGRVAVLNNYLRADQLEECLQIQRSEFPQRLIGDILLEKGYLTQEQLQTVLEIRRKKVRKAQRNPQEVRESDKVFGMLALQAKLITLDDLEDAVLEQQRLGLMNLHFRLGEIFVARGKMEIGDVLALLHRQGRQILLCPSCDTHYNVTRFEEGRTYSCAKCNARLLEPKFLDTVGVDAVLEGDAP